MMILFPRDTLYNFGETGNLLKQENLKFEIHLNKKQGRKSLLLAELHNLDEILT